MHFLQTVNYARTFLALDSLPRNLPILFPRRPPNAQAPHNLPLHWLSAPASFAHADTINGAFTATNAYDQFTSSSLTFVGSSPASTPGLGTVDGNVGGASTATGTFLTYFGAGGGEAINYFPAFPTQTPLPYVQGNNAVPDSSIFAPGQTGVELFTVTGGGETFNFYMQNYNAMYGQNITGCASGDTCLLVTGNGYFLASGTDPLTSPNRPRPSSSPASYTSRKIPTTTFEANARHGSPQPLNQLP